MRPEELDDIESRIDNRAWDYEGRINDDELRELIALARMGLKHRGFQPGDIVAVWEDSGLLIARYDSEHGQTKVGSAWYVHGENVRHATKAEENVFTWYERGKALLAEVRVATEKGVTK